METNDQEDKDYYNNLHDTARHYQTQQWAIPAVFLATQLLLLDKLIFDGRTKFLTSGKNVVLLLFNIASSSLLWLILEKHHLWVLLLQSKITEFDKKFDAKKNITENKNEVERIPMYSIDASNIIIEMAKWELREQPNKIDIRLRLAGIKTVSRLVSNFMILTIIGSFCLAIIILYKKIF